MLKVRWILRQCNKVFLTCFVPYCDFILSLRYLREEKVEIQVWVTYGSRKHHKHKPQHRDKLIGTVYIDMESLNDERRKQHRIR